MATLMIPDHVLRDYATDYVSRAFPGSHGVTVADNHDEAGVVATFTDRRGRWKMEMGSNGVVHKVTRISF